MSNGMFIKDKGVSVDIEALIEEKEGNVVATRFLDGSYQVQSVGKPSNLIKFTIYAQKNMLSEIERAYHEGEEVIVYYNGSFYQGLIISKPQFSYSVNEELNDKNKFFSASITMYVESSGGL